VPLILIKFYIDYVNTTKNKSNNTQQEILLYSAVNGNFISRIIIKKHHYETLNNDYILFLS